MKRIGHLWPHIVERGNLVRAFHQAARGKRQKIEVRRFAENLDENLDRLRQELMDRTFETGKFNVFKVFDPKERTIHAARFPERVFHHALMNLCEPVLERQAVFHSYACRKGKGRLKAIEVAQTAARRHGWQLKLDIRKYFESIPQERLIVRLQRLFKDPEVLHWLEKIIRGHRGHELEIQSGGGGSIEFDHGLHRFHGLGNPPDTIESGFSNLCIIRVNPCNPWFKNDLPGQGKGLPIGSLTSQHLANFYLGPLDRFCQEHPAVKAYCRYMDDFVCWGEDKAAMITLGREIQCFVEAELGLLLKHPPCPQPTARGMDFLGYRIFPSHAALNRRSKVRYWRRIRLLDALHEGCMISARALQERLTALTAFVLPVRSHGFRRGVMEKIRSARNAARDATPLGLMRDTGCFPRVGPVGPTPGFGAQSLWDWKKRFRSAAIGLEPGEPGRQLEQQREQLPRCEPQQQQPVQLEQQHRLPPSSQLRPQGMDVPAMSQMGLNRPPSRSHPASGCDKMTKRPPGAGRPVDAVSKAPGGSWAFHSHRRTQSAATRRTMRGTVAALCERRCQSVAVSRNSLAATVTDRRYKLFIWPPFSLTIPPAMSQSLTSLIL